MKTSLKIIAMFSVAILFSFITENFRSFFGDWKCLGSGELIAGTWQYQKCNYSDCGIHDSTWHWGYRHYLFFLMGLVLFIMQSVDIIDSNSNSN